MDRARLIEAVAGVVGPAYVISDPAELKVYEADGLTIFKATPDVVALPKSAVEVADVVRLCVREQVPFVPRGVGTGLSGGALAVEGGVVIGLNRMNRVLEVDYANQRAVIEPGVINIWLTNQVSPDGYYYAPDPASQSVCTIGGNVAFNSGGVHCLKYGMTSNHILGIKAVLADGEVVTLGGDSLEAAGPDLPGVFVGNEGFLA